MQPDVVGPVGDRHRVGEVAAVAPRLVHRRRHDARVRDRRRAAPRPDVGRPGPARIRFPARNRRPAAVELAVDLRRRRLVLERADVVFSRQAHLARLGPGHAIGIDVHGGIGRPRVDARRTFNQAEIRGGPVREQRRVREVRSAQARRRAVVAEHARNGRDVVALDRGIVIHDAVPRRAAVGQPHAPALSVALVVHDRVVRQIAAVAGQDPAAIEFRPVAYHHRIDQAPAAHEDPAAIRRRDGRRPVVDEPAVRHRPGTLKIHSATGVRREIVGNDAEINHPGGVVVEQHPAAKVGRPVLLDRAVFHPARIGLNEDAGAAIRLIVDHQAIPHGAGTAQFDSSRVIIVQSVPDREAFHHAAGSGNAQDKAQVLGVHDGRAAFRAPQRQPFAPWNEHGRGGPVHARTHEDFIAAGRRVDGRLDVRGRHRPVGVRRGRRRVGHVHIARGPVPGSARRQSDHPDPSQTATDTHARPSSNKGGG